MKGICIYKSKYGATAQYANWLGEALYLPALNIDDQTIQPGDFDYIVIGTPVYFGKFLIKSWLEKNEEVLLDKKIYLFVVSSADGKDTNKQQEFLQQNIPAALLPNIEVSFVPGRVVLKNLSLFDRLMVILGSLLEKDPFKKTMMKRGFDAVKRQNINPIIKSILIFSNSEILA